MLERCKVKRIVQKKKKNPEKGLLSFTNTNKEQIQKNGKGPGFFYRFSWKHSSQISLSHEQWVHHLVAERGSHQCHQIPEEAGGQKPFNELQKDLAVACTEGSACISQKAAGMCSNKSNSMEGSEC